MSRILIFAGTTEGRTLAEMLERSGVACDVSVATEYGTMVLNASAFVKIHQGRLDAEGMKCLYKEIGCDIVIDATHPYAEIVTETIKNSLEGSNITYIRLLRDSNSNNPSNKVSATNIFRYDSTENCAKSLEKTDGNILLTTGSKELSSFCNNESLKHRLIVRVLPGMESLKLCYDANLEGKQIIAMQGPFTKTINKALIEQYDIKHLVTKESGTTGGVDTKIEAAIECGIDVHMIERPDVDQTGFSMNETINKIEKLLEIKINKGIQNIILAGIGCGSEECLTVEVKNAIDKADYIFGAERMLKIVSSNALKYPYYLAKDIIPILEQIKEESVSDSNIVILFSGDPGFYSGAEKMYQALIEKFPSVKILPGISSITLLSAKIGISWQDAKILSLHGIDENIWRPQLIDAVRYNKKIFFICSGVKDIRRVGDILEEKDNVSSHISIYVGYQLSYSNESISTPTIRELQNFTEEGLYVCAIINDSIDNKTLTPNIKDSEFLRSEQPRIPMTKEDIRHLSVCRMNLKAGDVVYDIGSGTGSVAIEIASLSSDIKVYAVECKDEAVSLIKNNVSKFGLNNIEVFQKTAPEGLELLVKADVAFIGGSRGHLRDILQKLYEINPNMRVVMNAVSMESITEMNAALKEYPVTDINISQVAVTNIKELGDYHMMQANNPVFIYSYNFTEGK
ncbi:MAG: precorrin-6A reductase [Eubacterium sp.]|nr:precorrin-6A reductase [Eubacterium sp.]